MNMVKQFYFVTVAYAGLACAAAFESPSSCMVQMKKNNSVSACVLDKPVYSLSDVSGVAMLDHIADAARIDLNDQPNDILSRLVYETVGNSLKSEIATADEATIACEIVPFIKRCRQTYDALSLDQRRCSLLGECDGQACPATRSTKPAVRSTFEGMVLDATTARYVETYCAFAPGGLLQDLRLLKQFKEQGKTVRTIVLIDISYGPVCQVMKAGKTFGLFNAAHVPLQNAVDYARLFCEKKYSLINLYAVGYQAHMLQQFKESVSELFPNTFQGLYIFDNAADYIQACIESPSLRADVLVGCDLKHGDIAPLSGEWQRAWDDYHKVEGNGLAISSIAALLTVAGVDQKRVIMRVKATTGMRPQFRISDAAGIRPVSEIEQKDIEKKDSDAVEALQAQHDVKVVLGKSRFY